MTTFKKSKKLVLKMLWRAHAPYFHSYTSAIRQDKYIMPVSPQYLEVFPYGITSNQNQIHLQEILVRAYQRRSTSKIRSFRDSPQCLSLGTMFLTTKSLSQNISAKVELMNSRTVLHPRVAELTYGRDVCKVVFTAFHLSTCVWELVCARKPLVPCSVNRLAISAWNFCNSVCI